MKSNLLKNNVFWVSVVTVAILMVPLIAMQFTEEVQWTAFDFVAMGVLLFIVGMLLTAVAGKLESPRHRIIARVAIVLGFFILWVEMATGGISRALGL